VLATKPPSTASSSSAIPSSTASTSAGHQLPYFDRVVMNIAAAGSSRPRPARRQQAAARYLRFDNYTFSRRPRSATTTRARLWRTARQPARALSQSNTTTRCGAAVPRDVRFRRALSLAVDRHEITRRSITASQGRPGHGAAGIAALPAASSAEQWAKFDIKQANALLDELGLTKRDATARACCPTGPAAADHRRDGRRIVRGIGRARAGARHLERGPASSCSPSPRSSRLATASSPRDDDGDQQGAGERPRHRRTPPMEFAPTATAAAMAEWGKYAKPRACRGGGPTCRSARSCSACSTPGSRPTRRPSAPRRGEHPRGARRCRGLDIGIVAGVPQPWSSTTSCARAGGGHLQLDPRAPFRHDHPDSVLAVRRRAGLRLAIRRPQGP